MTEIKPLDLQRAQLLLDKKLFTQLKRYAYKHGSSNSEVARRAIRLFLEEHK